jgi:hypothetical protein
MKQAIIVFQKFPEPGKVKTRLASSIGAEKATFIYTYLLAYTHNLLKSTAADILVFHEGPIDQKDYPLENYRFYPQEGNDLGEKMYTAFVRAFKEGYEKVLIIGTDCHELKNNHLEQAFNALETHDLILGPAFDGGYYLIGLKKVEPLLFKNIQWSTAAVLSQTIFRADTVKMKTFLLEKLNDIDEYKDLNHTLKNLL